METSLGRLQKQVDTQGRQIIRLQDNLEHQKKEKKIAQYELKKYKEQVEVRIEKALKKQEKELRKKYEKELSEKDKRIFELECRLNINSETSSLPSSKDPIDKAKKEKTEIQNSREKTECKVGGQKGHPKSSLKKFDDSEITEIVEHSCDECPNCHSKNLSVIETKERDELDTKTTIEKKRHTFLTKVCNECGYIIKTEIPQNLHGENQYGSEIKSLIIMLYDYGFVSYNRIRDIISGFTNEQVNPSEGYMVKLQKKAGLALDAFVFDIAEVLKKSQLLHWDDTVVGIGEKDKACFRAYSDRLFVLFKAHMAKNIDGMNEDGILQNLQENTIVVHDHLLHNYCDDYKYQNAECNAHITRKLKGISVNTKHNWSDEMEKFLKNILELRKEYIDKKISSFSETELKGILDKYDEIVSKGFIEYKELKHKYEYTNEENLLEFLRDYKENITFWIKDFSVPYSNNFVESLLRMIKTKMKISLNFKSLEQARYFANIRSYTETCGNFGINKPLALKRLFEGVTYTVEELISLKNSQKEESI